jgi:hypothetical protein
MEIHVTYGFIHERRVYMLLSVALKLKENEK